MDSFTMGTTPDFCFEIDRDLSDWDVYVTFGQLGRNIATVRGPDVEPTDGGCLVRGRLTQEQTLRFRPGDAEAQIRAEKHGVAGATGCWGFEVRKIILPGTIPREVGE